MLLSSLILLTSTLIGGAWATAIPQTQATCDVGYTDCPNYGCTNLQDSPWNCGTCGHFCGPWHGQHGLYCQLGKCVCILSENTVCGQACYDLQTEVDNCGSCGHKCANDQKCSKGKCVSFCSDGLTKCDNGYGGVSCYNLQTDNSNCGSCGSSCNGYPFTGCAGGKCITCSNSQYFCNGLCTNSNNDNHNCGGCGNVCQTGSNCVNGKCQDNSGCGPGQARCGTDCINTNNDNRHCGACNTKCAVGKNCVNGQCR